MNKLKKTAINAAMDRAESARQYGADLFQKFNKLILDTSSSYGHNKFDEMIEKTSTTFAPWFVLESNDKKYARIKALEILKEEIEKRL